MKQKTNRAANKRFHVSSKGKVRRRVANQAHFNARDIGRETRRKHATAGISAADRKRLQDLLPYA